MYLVPPPYFRQKTILFIAPLFVLFLLSNKVFSQSCKAEITRQQSIASSRMEAFYAEYRRCIACCDGTTPTQATTLCGAYPTPLHATTDGNEVWTEGTYCNPFVTDGGSCRKIEINRTQCTLTDEKQPPACPISGNPIIIATGNKFQFEEDYKSQSPQGLNFTRYYNSSANNKATSIGRKWTHNFSDSLNASTSHVLIHHSDGHMSVFNYEANDWVGEVDVPDTLGELTNAQGDRTGWQYKDSNDTVKIYDASGNLLSVTNRVGETKTLIYALSVGEGGDGDDATLDQVVGFGDETISFGYENNVNVYPRRISTVTSSDGAIYRYSYDNIGNLVRLTYPNATARTYHYENNDFPYQLTGITNEKNIRFATWSYDGHGRAISSEYADTTEKETLVFNADDQVTVTNSLGKQTTYHFADLHGVKKVTQVEGHPSANCAGANQAYTYDANGFMASKTDWEGNVTSYIHNDRGQETSRTEASGTPQARTITTEWHAEFNLPIKITKPKRETIIKYDANGRLLMRENKVLGQ